MGAKPVVWVTGGTSGIGLAIARSLLAEEYCVAICGRNRERLERARKLLEMEERCIALECDIRSHASVVKAHQSIRSHFGTIDVLINNAGISPFGPLVNTTVKEFDDVIGTNLTGSYFAIRSVLPEMYARKSGTIVQILSVASKKAFKDGAIYAASKFGALGMIEAVREESRKYNVKVIAVFPGATATPVWDDEDLKNFQHRMMQPEDIAHSIVQLLGDSERMMTEEIVLRPVMGDLE